MKTGPFANIESPRIVMPPRYEDPRFRLLLVALLLFAAGFLAGAYVMAAS